ncbi:gamma-glutamylcyclotransferase [Methylocucumis oryzae]
MSLPHEYVRKCLPVQLTTGKTVNAWVYVYNRDVSGLKRIISGDYLADT